MLGKLRKYDAYLKAIDGVYIQSSLGGILTFISTFLIIFLLQGELFSYFRSDVINHMRIDKSNGIQPVRLSFDVEFSNMKCSELTFVQEATRESVHVDYPVRFMKDPIGENGCRVTGFTLSDRSSGFFKIGQDRKAMQMGSKLDISHKINHITFLPENSKAAEEDDIPGIDHPLNGREKKSENGACIHQYGLQVIETEYSRSIGETLHANQYSVSERDIDINQCTQGIMIGGEFFKDFSGILVQYQFYPVSCNYLLHFSLW